MKAAWMKGALFFLALMQVLFVAGQLAAQEDAPIPPGDPSTWGIPGHIVKLPVKSENNPPNIFSAPSPPGNERQNQPTGPAGEAEEKYTGTRAGFGGIAGTGIDQSGTHKNR
jgi:hypothetical protein